MVVRMGRHTVHLAGRRVACIRVLLILAGLSTVVCEIVTWTCAKFLGNVYDFRIRCQQHFNNPAPNRIQIWQKRHFRKWTMAIFGGRRF
jgi:hypothetical protein